MSPEMWCNVVIIALLVGVLIATMLANGTTFADADLKYAAMAEKVDKVQVTVDACLVAINGLPNVEHAAPAGPPPQPPPQPPPPPPAAIAAALPEQTPPMIDVAALARLDLDLSAVKPPVRL